MPRRGSTKEIFSTHDAAKICRVTPMTVIRWIEEGKIPAFKTVGGHRRILRADLDAFCRSRGIPFDPDGDSSRGRVLVVDADPATRDAVADAVRIIDAGFSIEMAGDAFDAGRLVAQFRPNLVFFDQRTPGVDALDVTSRLSHGREGPPINVVVMAPVVTADNERAFRTRGALALLPKPPTPVAVDRLVRQAFHLPEAVPWSIAPRTVLVIDDDVVFARAFRRDVEATAPGCRVLCCDTGTDGLLAIGSEHPDVILLDLALPDLDAFEVIRRIRSRLASARVTILGVADRLKEDLRALAVAAGASAVLEKPFDAERVLEYLGDTAESVTAAKAAAARRAGKRKK